jgi:hypothetical protein
MVTRWELNRQQASSFARLALKAIQQEYPNKPEHVLNSDADIRGPRALHAAFYGSFDWHSSVHGHWMLVRLLRIFPDLPERSQIRVVLAKHLTAQNLQAEADYFAQPNHQSFERTYGWAWLLKLAEELHDWDDPEGRQWSRNVQPLAETVVARYLAFLPKQNYPIRSGVHPNTAFGLCFALDYARVVKQKPLRDLIEQRSRDYYATDAEIPAAWEPSGADFLSPSLMEADLMRRVMPPAEFRAWLKRFLPGLSRGEPKTLFTPAEVTDRSDPQLVHLDGVNLSRAWCMRSIAAALPQDDPARKVLVDSAAWHAEAALRNVASGDYVGEHWLASFAVYLLSLPDVPIQATEIRGHGGLLQPQFQRHVIDNFPAGYQVAVADLNGDGRPDVIALSTDADRVDWYENPTWRRQAVARTAKNIDLAVRDLNGNGHPVIALASGFYFNESNRGGEIQILRQPAKPDDLWLRQPIAADPVVHRLRWGNLDGSGRQVLVHAPIFGPSSRGAEAPKPAHLWAFRPPLQPGQPWETWKIDESLTVLHGVQVKDLDGSGRDAILTASFEGIHRFDFKGHGAEARWQRVKLASGAPPASDQLGAPRGSSEVAAFHLTKGRMLLAAIEPWHGNQVVVYSPAKDGGLWQRHVIDDSLSEGHALVTGDFDGDGQDEIVAGWRGSGGGLRLYKASDATGQHFKSIVIDPTVPAEGAVAADINGDGRLDLVVIAGRANHLAWYENLGNLPVDRR